MGIFYFYKEFSGELVRSLPILEVVQSRTIKDNKKKKSNRSLFFSIRIDAYQLGEDPDKISLNFNEPFPRKLLFKKI